MTTQIISFLNVSSSFSFSHSIRITSSLSTMAIIYGYPYLVNRDTRIFCDLFVFAYSLTIGTRGWPSASRLESSQSSAWEAYAFAVLSAMRSREAAAAYVMPAR